MDLEVVGRHALYFDDDAMAAFVNSGDALVEWNSLQIDRYDVRHLLSAPPPSRRRRNPPPPSSYTSESSFEAELDHERYLDLHSTSNESEPEEGDKPADLGGYRAVAFSYGNGDEPVDGRNVDEGLERPGFCPSFQVPDSLLPSLPPSEKVHQIIARTAMFVCKHGGQSEIILRVKQGDNPTFGFLMPDHHLHAYFRFLVDHQELLQPEERRADNEENKSDAVGGALSLLGSVYGSGEDEDGDKPESNKTLSGEKVSTVNSLVSQGSGRSESSTGAGEKEHALPSQKSKASLIKKNPSVNSMRVGSATIKKKEDTSKPFSAAEEKLKDSSIGGSSKVEPIVIEPPSDIKRTIDKIVDFITKNGKQFEATLVEQDSKHGRFPFLLPSNQYHPFYLQVLQEAQESKLSFLLGKDESAGQGAEKKVSLSRENDSAGSDLPFDSERKEKFKMVIGKTKKDGQDANSKGSPQEFGVTVDAAAAAAILQAAARGIRNPDLGIISSTFFNDKINGQGREDGQGLKSFQKGERSASVPLAEEAAGVPDSEAHLTKEQKLKAERLKKAKMFVAMLKGGAGPGRTDQRDSSVEPQPAAVLGSGIDVNLSGKAREGSSAPPDGDISDKNEEPEKIHFNDEYNERRSKRTYRSRSERHGEEDGKEDEEDREQKPSRKKHRPQREDDEEGRGQKEQDRRHSKRKKHRSSRSSLADEDDEVRDRKRSRRKHRSRHLSEEDNDGQGEDDSESFRKSSRRKHRSRHSSEDSYGKEEESFREVSRRKHRSRHSSADSYDLEEDESESYRRSSRDKHGSHHSSEEEDSDNKEDESESYRKSSRRKHSSHRSSWEEGDEEHNDNDRNSKSSRKKHRSRSSSRRSRYDHKHKHSKGHSSKDEESKQESKHDISSEDDEYLHSSRHAKHLKESPLEELEEGEIGSKFSDQSRESGGAPVSHEASLGMVSSHLSTTPQPSEATDVSDDLRAKIRAMLMATR